RHYVLENGEEFLRRWFEPAPALVPTPLPAQPAIELARKSKRKQPSAKKQRSPVRRSTLTGSSAGRSRRIPPASARCDARRFETPQGSGAPFLRVDPVTSRSCQPA